MKEGNIVIYYAIEMDDTVIVEVSREHKPTTKITRTVHRDQLIQTAMDMVREVMCVD